MIYQRDVRSTYVGYYLFFKIPTESKTKLFQNTLREG